jgi:hypothetical protein
MMQAKDDPGASNAMQRNAMQKKEFGRKGPIRRVQCDVALEMFQAHSKTRLPFGTVYINLHSFQNERKGNPLHPRTSLGFYSNTSCMFNLLRFPVSGVSGLRSSAFGDDARRRTSSRSRSVAL